MRQKRIRLAAGVAVVAIVSAVVTTAFAGGGKEVREKLTGDEEVPVVLTDAEGKFKAKLFSDRVEYTLRYEDLEGSITQAHIHVGQRLANGGIAVWLCGTASNPGPAGTPVCEPSPGTVTDSFTADDVVDTAQTQGITTGEFDELVDAIREGFTYVNVHSTLSPTGEMRAQLEDDDDDDDRDHDRGGKDR
jgi:CHRD domain